MSLNEKKMKLTLNHASFSDPEDSPFPFKSALRELQPPTEMIYEIWDVVFDYTAPDIEVRHGTYVLHCRKSIAEMHIFL